MQNEFLYLFKLLFRVHYLFLERRLMFQIFSHYDFTIAQWLVVILSGFFIGMDKSGIPTFLILVPIMAQILGGKISAGFLLPLLVIGDVFAVIYYKRHSEIKMVLKLLPWAVLGILAGLVVGNNISDNHFKMIMGITIMTCVVLLMIRKNIEENDTDRKWYFSAVVGVLGGFSTMIGNAGGPIMMVYFLSMNFNKNTFIGTVAWFFFVVNLIKIPLYAFVWHNISFESFSLNLTISPLIIAGALIGVRLVKYVPDRPYRLIMLSITVINAVKLMV